jgi:hypothetical protein
MDIYSPITITEKISDIFKPTRLCIKKLAGKYYFCKSTKLDIVKYKGSGDAWKRRMKKYGKENVETIWISDWYYTPQEIHEVALHFSRENNIVRSDLWVNLAPEWGLDFYTRKGVKESDDTRQRKRNARLGSKNPMYGLKGTKSPIYGRIKPPDEVERLSEGVKKYCETRPQSHNDNISKSLKGNPNLIAAVTGDKNPGFKGYYISPTGERFDSSRKAAVVAGVKDKKTLISWAKSNKNGWTYEPKNFTDTDTLTK